VEQDFKPHFLKVFFSNMLKAGLINLICCNKLYTHALQTSVKQLSISYSRLMFIHVLHGLYAHRFVKVTLSLWVH